MTEHTRLRTVMLRRLIYCAAAAGICVLLFLLSLLPNGLFFKAYSPWSRFISGLVGFVVSFAPFSVAELLLYGGIIWLVTLLVLAVLRTVRRTDGALHLMNFGVTLLTVLCTAALLFFGLWGMQYRAPRLESQLEFPVQAGYSQTELVAATRSFHAQLCAIAPLTNRDGEGRMTAGFAELGHQTVTAMSRLAQEDPTFRGGLLSRPKRVLAYQMMDYLYIAGIYCPFTGECNVNPNSSVSSLAFDMAHEMAHRLGYAPEDEASFVAFLTCMASEDPDVIYSGLRAAFNQCYWEIDDGSIRDELTATLPAEYWADSRQREENTSYINEAIAEVTAAVSEKANDTYLKINGQEDGTRSYSRVVRLLIAWYLAAEG